MKRGRESFVENKDSRPLFRPGGVSLGIAGVMPYNDRHHPENEGTP